MGIEVVVEDEHGKAVTSITDPTNILHRILPSQDDESFHCLNRIDWYGDTIFNRYQLPDVHRELKRLATGNRTREELELIQDIDSLATRCESEPHLYLAFHGD